MSTTIPSTKPAESQTKSAFDPSSVAEKIKIAIPDAVVSSASNGIVVQAGKLPDVVRYLRDTPDLEPVTPERDKELKTDRGLGLCCEGKGSSRENLTQRIKESFSKAYHFRESEP